MDAAHCGSQGHRIADPNSLRATGGWGYTNNPIPWRRFMKVNVYLPDELSKRVKERDIPVSAVCQQALEERIRVADAVSKARADLAPVVERLARERAEEANAAYRNGFEAGVEWARSRASWWELGSLAEMAQA